MQTKLVIMRSVEGLGLAVIVALVVVAWRSRVPGGRPPTPDQWRRSDQREPANT